jgi:hypothetical protein
LTAELGRQHQDAGEEKEAKKETSVGDVPVKSIESFLEVEEPFVLKSSS